MSDHPSPWGGIVLLFSDDHHCTKLTHDVVSSISSHFPPYQKEADAAASSRRTVGGCLTFSSLA
jgi:hypothetical protein